MYNKLITEPNFMNFWAVEIIGTRDWHDIYKWMESFDQDCIWFKSLSFIIYAPCSEEVSY